MMGKASSGPEIQALTDGLGLLPTKLSTEKVRCLEKALQIIDLRAQLHGLVNFWAQLHEC